jgi:hypothetical protein
MDFTFKFKLKNWNAPPITKNFLFQAMDLSVMFFALKTLPNSAQRDNTNAPTTAQVEDTATTTTESAIVWKDSPELTAAKLVFELIFKFLSHYFLF